MTDPKVTALAAHLNVAADTITDEGNDTYSSTEAPGEYMVLTDSEADAAFQASVENYIEDCVLPEIPESYRMYFNSADFIRDVELSDGRGQSLAGYDGAENEEQVDGAWYYIYRTN